jgi:hypothetical protein
MTTWLMGAGVLRVIALVVSNSSNLPCLMIYSSSSSRGYDEFVLEIR